MGKVQRILDLIEEIRKNCIDLMAEAPRSTWKSIMTIDDSLDMIKYWTERLQDKYIDAAMND